MSAAADRKGIQAERLREVAALRAVAGIGDVAEGLSGALVWNDTAVGAGVAGRPPADGRRLCAEAEQAAQIIAPRTVYAGIRSRPGREHRAVAIADKGHAHVAELDTAAAGRAAYPAVVARPRHAVVGSADTRPCVG
ncbi:hypothetical protein Y023_5699 [Burkholderia pseudomallei A79D]|nr:hypothetical protein X947_5681 [Burkholderia pseudomallei MSHR7334]KGX94673.1 hypothetical protein Y023_5699 [Burkholderia pseudomallei A79D]